MVFLIRRVEEDKRRVTRIGVGKDPAFGPFKKNLLSCKLTRECYDIFLDRAERWILSYSDPGNPSLIFLDPPYQENHYPQILKQLADSDSIQKGSVIAIESPKKMEFEFQNSLVLMVRKTYGGTALDLLEKQ